MARLPVVGGDRDNWGQVLNDYLSVEHNADGTLKLRDDGTLSGVVTNSEKGAPSGVATLDGSSKLTTSQLPDSVASGDEAVYRSRGIPSVLDHNGGVAPDGTSDNIAAFEAAAADAIARGKGQVVVPAAPNSWRISRPLPLTVDWIGFGRHATGTKIKATTDFDGTKMFDIDSTSNVLRRIAHMRIDCSMVPGLRAIGSDDAFGAGVGRLHEVHIISVAPTIVTRLTAGATLGGTQVLSVEDATRFRLGIIKFAGSGSALSVTAVDEGANTITVSNGSGTYLAGHALEQPVWAIEAGPHSGATATGAMVGWIFDGVQLNNCAHLLRLPVTAGDDLNVVNFRSAPVETAVGKTLSATFTAGTDTTMSLNSTSGLRASGRVVVSGHAVWYTGINGSTLTGVYTAHVGAISSGTTVEQFARPIDAPFDIDGVNMRFESVYTQLGMTDDVGSGGIKALWKIGGQVTHLVNLFPEEVPTGHNFTHLFFAQQPSCALEINGISPNFDTASEYVALVRTQLASMSAGQRKYVSIKNYRPDSTDVSDERPLVDLFVGSDAESNGNALDLNVEGASSVSKIGRFGASSTVSTLGVGVVRVTGTWKGARLDDNLACLTADADWPDIVSHFVRSSGTPEGSLVARPGSTCFSRRLGSGTNGTLYPVHWTKVSGSGNTGWIGRFTGSGVPDYDATVGSTWLDVASGTTWQKVVAGASGWQAQSDGIIQAWVSDDNQNPTLGVVPANVYITGVYMYVHEAFNSDGTDNITVGRDSLPDALADDTDVSTTGEKTPAAGTGAKHYSTSQTVKAYYTNGGSEPTTGKALVTVSYRSVPAVPA